MKKARTVPHFKSVELTKQPNSRKLPFISQESVEEGAPLLFSPINYETTPGETPVIFQKSDTVHVLDDIILGSESLNKIVNTTAFVLRLVGRRKLNVPKDFHTKDLQVKYNSNPITAAEHDDALKTLIHHEQVTKLDVKKLSGFNLEDKDFVLSSGKVLKLITLRSRVQNFPLKFGNDDDSVFVLPASTFARRITVFYHR